jgi:hypothetical protein
MHHPPLKSGAGGLNSRLQGHVYNHRPRLYNQPHKTTCDCLVSNYYNRFQNRALCVSLHTGLVERRCRNCSSPNRKPKGRGPKQAMIAKIRIWCSQNNKANKAWGS